MEEANTETMIKVPTKRTIDEIMEIKALPALEKAKLYEKDKEEFLRNIQDQFEEFLGTWDVFDPRLFVRDEPNENGMYIVLKEQSLRNDLKKYRPRSLVVTGWHVE